MHGAGSLAHEWWHGLDDYLGTKMGAKGMLSEQPRLYAPFQKLIDTMKYKPETRNRQQSARKHKQNAPKKCGKLAGFLDYCLLKRYGDQEQMKTYAVLREAFLSGEPGSVEQISAFKKNVTGRVIPKSERERLEIFERMLFPGCRRRKLRRLDGRKQIFTVIRYAWEKNVKKTAVIGTAMRK